MSRGSERGKKRKKRRNTGHKLSRAGKEALSDEVMFFCWEKKRKKRQKLGLGKLLHPRPDLRERTWRNKETLAGRRGNHFITSEPMDKIWGGEKE